MLETTEYENFKTLCHYMIFVMKLNHKVKNNTMNMNSET